MSANNPRRRSWQRTPPLPESAEVPKHQRRAKRDKPYGVRVTYHRLGADLEPWVWTRWYATEAGRESAFRSYQGGHVQAVEKVDRA